MGDAARRQRTPFGPRRQCQRRRPADASSRAAAASTGFTDRGHANLYQLFTERALSLARPGGRIGLVLPRWLCHRSRLRRHSDDTCSTRHTVDSLVVVDNREAIFPVHRGLRFLLMTTDGGGRTAVVPLRPGRRTPRISIACRSRALTPRRSCCPVSCSSV